jgi:hypothetical protein
MTSTLASPPSVAARPLFEALYGNADEAMFFALFAGTSKAAYFFRASLDGIEQALEKVAELDAAGEEVYQSMYLLDEIPPSGRGTEATAKALCCRRAWRRVARSSMLCRSPRRR